MHDEVSIINQNPATSRFAFHPPWERVRQVLGVVGNTIGKGLELPIVITVTDKKVISKYSLFAYVK
jgi:hypothetical protein